MEAQKSRLVSGMRQFMSGCAVTLLIAVGCSSPAVPAKNTPSVAEASAKGKLRIHAVGSKDKARRGDVVFLHGLEGNELTTWESKEGDLTTFWPGWLSEDFPKIGIWSVGYNARISEWEGGTMAFQDRAKSILERLRLEGIGTTKPVIFVVHSLGGIVIKQMLRISAEGTEKRWKTFSKRTRGVVFLATPHTGSNLGSYLENLATLLGVKATGRPTVLIEQLRANAPELRELNEWYRGHVKRLHIETRALYETEEFIPGHKVVDEGPSDPAIPDLTADPVDATHITIAKPISRDELVYKSVAEFIDKYLTPDDPWNVTLPEFLNSFNDSRDKQDVSAFNRDYGGKRVRFTGIVRFVLMPKEDPEWQPGYMIAIDNKSPGTEWVLVNFDPEIFRSSVKIGDSIAITGRVGRENSASGARLYECDWQDSSSEQAGPVNPDVAQPGK